MTWTHGTNGLLIGYAISAAAVLFGLLLGRAPLLRILLSPLIASPVFLVAVMLWTALSGPLQSTPIPFNAIPYLGLGFIAIFSGLAGKLLAHLPENKNHKRGTIVSDLKQNP